MDVQVTLDWQITRGQEPPVTPPDTRLSELPPGRHALLGHDASCDDGANGKPPYEPRGKDLPETEKRKHPEHAIMDSVRAGLWFEAFKLCAPKQGLEKLPWELRQARDLQGNMHTWLDDYWYDRLAPLEQWWLFLIYWSRALTNKVSVDLPGFYDPITGFGIADSNGRMVPFKMEGVTTCGNPIWLADGVSGAGVAVWCLDGLASSYPPASHILKYRSLMHVFTISTTANHNPTVIPNYPKGVWDVIPYGILNGNAVPIPQFSTWTGENSKTMVWNDIPLRVDWYPTDRILPYLEPWNPYVPALPLFPRG